jgi:hypothetical protein
MMIQTTKGQMDDSLLAKHEEIVDNENEHTVATEYRLEGELVHRSVHVTLKKVPRGMEAVTAALFG